jgi:hypothetical protein
MYLIEENDTRFYIKESTIPGAGLGVFAKCPLKTGDFLEIIGAQVEVGSIADQCTHFADKYKFAATGKIKGGKRVIEHTRKIVPFGYGGMVNHAPTPEQQNAVIDYHKTPIQPAAGQAIYRFTRDIERDEEVLGNYGEHWQNMLAWAGNKAVDVDRDWETFLAYDLYNLGRLKQELPYQE